MPLLFVYGTLKQDFALHDILRQHGAKPRFMEARTKFGYLLDVSPTRPFPYMFYRPAGWNDEWAPPLRIKGEVYKVSNNCLDLTDYVEGVPHHFRRVTIQVLPSYDTDDAISCEAYVAQRLPRPNSYYAAEFKPDNPLKDYAVDL